MAIDSGKSGKTLQEIKQELKELNQNQKEIEKDLEISHQAMPAVKLIGEENEETRVVLRGMRDELKKRLEDSTKAVKELEALQSIKMEEEKVARRVEREDQVQRMREIIENLSPKNIAIGLIDGFKNFFGMDFKEKWDNFTSRMAELPAKIEGLGEKMGNWVGEKRSDIIDAFATLAKLVAAIIGIYSFMEGMEKATKWFGANADFGDKVASGLANVAGVFLGLEDETRKSIAITVADFFDAIGEVVGALTTAIGKTIEWLAGDQLSVTEVLGAFSDLGSKLWEFKGEVAIVAAMLAPKSTIMLATKAISLLFTGIGAGLTALQTVGVAGLSTAITGAVVAFAPVVAIAAGIGLVLGSLYRATQSAYDEYQKSGDMFESIKVLFTEFMNVGIGSILNAGKWLVEWGAKLLGFEETAQNLANLDMVEEVRQFREKVSTKLREWFSTLPDTILNNIKTAFDPILTLFDGLKEKIFSILPERVQKWLSEEKPEEPKEPEKSSWWPWSDNEDPMVRPTEDSKSLELANKVQQQEQEIKIMSAQIAQLTAGGSGAVVHQSASVKTDNTFHTSPFKTVTPTGP